MPQEQARAGRAMLNRKQERVVHFDFDCLLLPWYSGGKHHGDGASRRGFGPFFVHADERFVKNIGNIQIIVGRAWGHTIKIRAALRDVERAFHPELFQGIA